MGGGQNNNRHGRLVGNAARLGGLAPGPLGGLFTDQRISDLGVPLGVFLVARLHHLLDRVVVGIVVAGITHMTFAQPRDRATMAPM